jgi:hypothetical protein
MGMVRITQSLDTQVSPDQTPTLTLNQAAGRWLLGCLAFPTSVGLTRMWGAKNDVQPSKTIQSSAALNRSASSREVETFRLAVQTNNAASSEIMIKGLTNLALLPSIRPPTR